MYLKINRNKKAQIMLEYVILITMSILAIIAVNIALEVMKDKPAEPGKPATRGFDTHFKYISNIIAGARIMP